MEDKNRPYMFSEGAHTEKGLFLTTLGAAVVRI